ncbi:MAG TPA: ABC transporter permease subunit [Beijerinckia sp.]|jgi:oligopeptide transport system permease protein|nr:ABC transporter permease subunit [Beijerinckia sp.]
MVRHILARVMAAVPTLFLIAAASFFLMRLAPGGPFDAERALAPEIAANLRHIYRLDLPLAQQFWLYLQSLLSGDFGPSFHWRDFTVNELFAKALPISAQLGGEAMALALIVGTALGLVSAIRQTGLVAHLVGAVALLGIIVPPFVVAPLLQLVFGLTLKSLPVGGWNEGAWRNQILPVVTLALPLIAAVARLTRAALIDVLDQPHIRTLRAFGLPAAHIYAHALRAASLPVLSYLGLAAANVLTGSVVVETIFGIPGMGRYFVDAALGRDYTIVMGTVIVIALLVTGFNLLVDLAYAWIDPRVRHE